MFGDQAPIILTHGYQYYVSFIDYFSCFVWVYPPKLKSDVQSTFLHFVRMVQNQFNTTIKVLQSDNGGECSKIHQLCDQMGIITRRSFLYTLA